MKKLGLMILGLALLAGCGTRVDYPIITRTASCNVVDVTDEVIRIECNDGTTLELPAPPPRVIPVPVPVTPTPEPTPEPTPLPEECEDAKITVCHKGKTIEISLNALPAHEGDAIGACIQVPEDPEDPECEVDCGGGDDEETPVMVTLCHKPGTPAEATLSIPSAAVPAHLGHGDYLGACESD